ncbi:MAG: phosphohydrolase [Anaerolineae bacterium]|nr:phosphohydrolase [Anaerolineae bacterium]
MPQTVGNADDGPDVAAAEAYALERLERELPPTLHYHSLWHTHAEVAPRAVWLAKREGLSQLDEALITTAAHFHDLGFTVARAGHERTSAKIAAAVLPGFGYTSSQIAAIQGMILATRLPQTPHTLLEQIVADADLDVLGREDFLSRNQALRLELAAAGATSTDAAWYSRQLLFLDQHHYFTPTARRERATGKARNRALLHDIIRDCCSRALDTPTTQPLLHGLSVPGALPAASPTSPFGGLGLVMSPTLR